MIRRPPRSPLFPYTPLSRSLEARNAVAIAKAAGASQYAGDSLRKAEDFLTRAEDYLRRKQGRTPDRKSTRLNSSHSQISYAVFCLKKKNNSAPAHILLVCMM